MRDSNSAVWLVGFLWQLQSSISPPLRRHRAFVSLFLSLALSLSFSHSFSLSLWSWQRETPREGIKLHQGFSSTHSSMKRNTHTLTHTHTHRWAMKRMHRRTLNTLNETPLKKKIPHVQFRGKQHANKEKATGETSGWRCDWDKTEG